MQRTFDFGAGTEIAAMRARLRPAFGAPQPAQALDPVSQLVRSSLGSRTRDAVSWAAFARLRRRWPDWAGLAAAAPREVLPLIGDVTFPEIKAPRIPAALRRIIARRGALDLGFLAGMPVGAAQAWLEGLPGVGPKVAAAVLDFSTLARPDFVADSHVLRVLSRFGVIGTGADAARARAAVTGAAED